MQKQRICKTQGKNARRLWENGRETVSVPGRHVSSSEWCCSAAGRELCSSCRTVLRIHSHLSPNTLFSVTHFIPRWRNLGADLLHKVSQSPWGAESRFSTHSVAVWHADAAAHGVNRRMGTDWELLNVRTPHPLDCFSTHHAFSFIISICSVSLCPSSNCQVPASSHIPSLYALS